MTQRKALPLPDPVVDKDTGKASQSWAAWFQEVNQALVTINDAVLDVAGNNTGVNTGDQTIVLSGAVSGTGTGAITTTYAGTVGVTTGGTGLTTMTTAYAPVCAGTTATGNLQVASTGLATSGYVLTSNGSAAVPSFQAIPADSDDWVYISTGTAASSSEIDFTGFSTYTSYQIRCYGVVPATAGVDLRCRVSVAAAFKTGATDYSYEWAQAASATVSSTQALTEAFILLKNNLATSKSTAGTIDIHGVGGGFETMVTSQLMGRNNAGNNINTWAKGFHTATTTVDGFRLYMSSGNITTGVFKLYGIR